jgi:glycosyltransferase involved in cell wall biosynthesis
VVSRSKFVLTGGRRQMEYAQRFNPRCAWLPPVLTRAEFDGVRPDEHRRPGIVTIGWIGTSPNLKLLQVIEPALVRLCREFPHMRLRIICNAPLSMTSIQDRIEFCPWSLPTYLRDMAGFDVAVSPLTPDEYSMAKGGRVSVLNSLALGVPVVISPGGGLEDHITDGVTGFLATSESEWYEKLRSLVVEPQLRQRIGAAGRELANGRFFSDCTFGRFYEIVRSVLAAE